ncbi:MAG: GntR family transcriptional regulator [Clostridia bacterium]|nr:GntR family transcriptional regulator [Clostridia bacterium]
MEHKNFSLADQVFERLESDILTGKYSRGDVMTEMKLCSELGVSRTPVREALTKLEQEHLIKETGKGIEILGITREDLADIMEIRLRTEGLAAYRCAENITEEQLVKLKETIELQEFYLAKNDSDKIKAMDSQFHKLIYLYSGSNVLLDTLEPLHNKVQRYRKASIENSGRAEKSVSEHRAVYEAISRHNAPLAEKKMTEHVNNAKNKLLKG